MPRLCSDSSRPYPGRSARAAVAVAMGVGLRPIVKAMELPPNPKAADTAQCPATGIVIGQKSAEAIVAQCPGYNARGMVRRRTQSREGASMSSHDTRNPAGGVNMRHVMEPPDPNDHLLERILYRENMRQAWKRVKANKGIAGVDNILTGYTNCP